MTEPLPDPIPDPDDLPEKQPLEPSVTNPDADGIDENGINEVPS